jgi:hypothetical protein
MNVRKFIKPFLIALPLNLLAGLLYCMVAKKMSIGSYSNALFFIGGAYAAIGGIGFLGGMDSDAKTTMIWARDSNQRHKDKNTRDNSTLVYCLIGICTILISYLLVKL